MSGGRLRLAALCLATALSPAARGEELAFDQAFSTRGEPAALHYAVVFTSPRGEEHRLEVWREGDRQVRRRTDEALETYAFRAPADPEFHLSILDRKRRIHTRIDRTNLYRIGSFTDWFDLAHGLRHPLGAYRLARAPAPEGAPPAVEGCRWYDLAQGGRTTHVCWSPRSRIPLLIQAEDGRLSWRVTAVDRGPIPPSTFEIHDEGYVRNDANADVERD
ncbi:MAG TPA: hypothetical protein VML50_01595 [Anaeromyxobacter sp.]|nr:hypothetical protein [Anaeromyxobacter sp.]